MKNKVVVTLALDAVTVERLNALSEKWHMPKSKLVREAIRFITAGEFAGALALDEDGRLCRSE